MPCAFSLRRERRHRRAYAAVAAADERAAAERRVAAAVQVEIALPHAPRREVADAEHGGFHLGRGPHPLQRGDGGVQLLHRRRRVALRGALGEQRLPRGHVVHVRPRLRPREAELVRHVLLQRRGAGRRCGPGAGGVTGGQQRRGGGVRARHAGDRPQVGVLRSGDRRAHGGRHPEVGRGGRAGRRRARDDERAEHDWYQCKPGPGHAPLE